MTTPIRSRFTAFIAALNASFPERSHIIEGLFLAILTGQHALLLGEPGTAKSLLTRTIGQGLGGRWWEKLLTRFTTPEEVFGPVSLKGLEQDRYERVTAGTLADTDFAFPDEIFKANSAILNSLLTALNERVFHNGTRIEKLALRSVFGASNEMPEGKELEALWDRFVLRFDVHYLQRDTAMRAMILAPEIEIESGLTLADLDTAQAEVKAIKLTDATVDAMLAMRTQLKAEGIVVSDRRWKACLKLAQASAWLSGEADTSTEDLAVLTDALWREPKERAKVAKVVGQHADPVGTKAVEALDAAREIALRFSSLPAMASGEYVKASGALLEEYKQTAKKVDALAATAQRRGKQTVADVQAEMKALADDLMRQAAMGLRLRKPTANA